jgi:hypothetical protein
MNILKFVDQFPDELSCRNDFKAKREDQGVICKKCSCTNHYWLQNKWQWQCKKCSFRTSIRSGTIMENSNLPVRMWYLCMALMTMTKKGISAKEMQRQLNHKRYEPIWTMMHKIRAAMGHRDALYSLAGEIEFDEGYFTHGIRKGSKPKRGRGSQNKKNVAVIAESTPLEDIETGKVSKQCRYFKMKVLGSHEADQIDELVQDTLNEKTLVFSDKSTSYVNISDYVEVHIQERSDAETTKTTLQWVHIAIANAKRWLLGIHHTVKGKYLQNYLNEFCYKLNRRYFGNRLFDRVSIALAKSYWHD